jgi:hypothetical protein
MEENEQISEIFARCNWPGLEIDWVRKENSMAML